ncbi:hypothetical protein MMC27_002146 [Xylographa pallens]|nr:hypothetical protein [Xylographa pallens]
MDVRNNNSLELSRGFLEDHSSCDTSANSSITTSRRGSVSGEDMSQGKEKSQVHFDSVMKPPTSRPSSDAQQENTLSGRLQEPGPSSGTAKPSPSIHSESKSLGIPIPAIIRSPPDGINSRAQSPVRWRTESPFAARSNDDIELEDLTELNDHPSKYTRAQLRKARSQKKANSQAQNLRREMEDSSNELYNHESDSEIFSSSPQHHTGMPFDPIDLNDRLNNAPARQHVMDETEGHGEGQRSAMFSAGIGSYIRGLVGRMKHARGPKIDSENCVRVNDQIWDLTTGNWSPVVREGDPEWYVPPPKKYRRGVLASWIKLYQDEGFSGLANRNSLSWLTPNISPHTSGTNTPVASDTPTTSNTPTASRNPHWWYRVGSSSQSTSSISNLLSASTVLAQSSGSPGLADIRPQIKRGSSSFGKLKKYVGAHQRSRSEHVVHVREHVVETSLRYDYMVALCHALMAYGAPTHRLEEYMRSTCAVLEVQGKFLFIPGCMLVSFEDPETRTSDVRIVRNDHSVDLSKLLEMHTIYKKVNRDKIGAAEGSRLLKELFLKELEYGPWTLVVFYGLASAFVGPFAFGSRLIDMPMAFVLGCLLGSMKVLLSPMSMLYSDIFEISAAVVTSFFARAFGSIRGGDVFCFSALAQSSIALILPGYIVLCGALELQSRNIVAGSVRMVYAIIYSLFLGFGLEIGTAFYGAIDRQATSETVCQNPISGYWKFLFVPPFTVCLIVINQGKLKQMPVMVLISLAGYVVNFFSSLKFPSNAQVSQTLGALTIGLMGNLYSRIWEGVSAAALLPAIFVQVPSGLAASGSLISGLTSANQITNGTNGTTTVSNGTQAGSVTININSTVFNVAYSMIQGLFMSHLIIYPLGKKRSGLFSF